MKKLSVLACSLLMLSACKDLKTKTVPDNNTEKPADTLKKDTIAYAAPTRKAFSEDKAIAAVRKTEKAIPEYASFGNKILAGKAISKEEMLKKYASMKKGDTIAVKFKSKVKEVCKKKGCWMSMELPDSKEAFVRFKDYGFFVPLNADRSVAIVSGKAFLDVVSVEELKHFAKDGGKSEEEISKITVPKITYAFTADGVLIQE